jgi:hypothetical protein
MAHIGKDKFESQCDTNSGASTMASGSGKKVSHPAKMSGTAESPVRQNSAPVVEMELPTFPLTLTETVDATALRKVIKLLPNDDTPVRGYMNQTNKSQLKMLKLYLQKLSGNVASVTYDHSAEVRKTKHGRVYAAASLGLQSFSRKVRKTIAGDLYWDLDITCCQPTILQATAAKYGWSCPALREYITHRAEYVRDTMAHYGVGYDAAKELYNRELYLGGIRAWRDAYGVDPELDDHPLAVAYLREVRTIAELMINHADFREEREIANKKDKRAKGDISLDSQKATMAMVCQSLEHEALRYAMAYLKGKGRPMRSLIFDGGLVERLAGETEFPADILAGLNQTMAEQCGIELRWVVKPMDEEPLPIQTVELTKEEEEGTGKVDDLYAAREFVKLMGSKLNRDGDSIYVFDETTGMWVTGDNYVRGAIIRNAARLIFEVEEVVGDKVQKKTYNYGGDLDKMNKIVKLLPALVRDTQFIAAKGDTGKYKILWANGIYDFNTATFTAGFDPETVFFHAIPRDFPVRKDDVVAKVNKALFVDPFQSEADPVNDMGNFYKNAITMAIVGEYRHKKFYFAIGDANSSKGALTDAAMAAFPGYVQTFTVNNLIVNDRPGADEARALGMWAKPLMTTRLAIGNECKMGEKGNRPFDGNIIKPLSGGGDILQMRNNFENITNVRWRTTMMVLANDVPPIAPSDAAIQYRCRYVAFRKVFVETADPSTLRDNEMLADPHIKERFKTNDDWKNALFWVLADRWTEIKDNPIYWEPECVRAESKAWVGDATSSDIGTVLADQFVVTKSADDWVSFSVVRSALMQAGIAGGMSTTKLGKEIGKVTGLGSMIKKDQYNKAVSVRLGLKMKDDEDVVTVSGGDDAGSNPR